MLEKKAKQMAKKAHNRLRKNNRFQLDLEQIHRNNFKILKN